MKLSQNSNESASFFLQINKFRPKKSKALSPYFATLCDIQSNPNFILTFYTAKQKALKAFISRSAPHLTVMRLELKER